MSTKAKLLSILLVAIALRLALFQATLAHDPTLLAFRGGDTPSYLAPAKGLAFTGNFESRGYTEIRRTPGYPLFLAIGMRAGHVEIITILLQVLLGAVIAYLIYLTTRSLTDSDACALVAALLYAVEPVSTLYTARLMTETLFALFLVLFLYLFCTYTKAQKPLSLVLAGLALACATLVRPISYYLPLGTFAFMIMWLLVERTRWRMRIAHAFLFLLVAIAPLLAWQSRNETLTGYAGLSCIREINLYSYHAAIVMAEQQHISLDDAQDILDDRLDAAEQATWDEGDRHDFMKARAIEIIGASPTTYAKIFVQGMVLNLLDPGMSKWLRHFDQLPDGSQALESQLFQKGLWKGLLHIAQTIPLWFWGNLLMGGLLLVYLCSAMWGVVREVPKFQPGMWFLFMVTAYFIVISGAMGSSRFRHPIMPMICILSAVGLVAVAHATARKKKHAISTDNV